MSDDTLDLACPSGQWTQVTIASGATSVVIGAGSVGLLVRKATAQPSAGTISGYGIGPGAEKTFEIEDGDALWVRPVPSSSGPGVAVVWS